MERKNKASIALGTYNGAKFLPAQLESFLAQTRLPDELIVCDDCSHDESVKIIENFASRAPFDVKIYVNPHNLGSSKNFEKAVSLCSKEIIFLSDQDDVWRADKIEKIIAEFEKSAALGLVFTDAELVDENLAPLGKRLCDLTFGKEFRHIETSEKMLELLMPRNYITGATMAFRSEYKHFFTPIPTDIPEMIHDAWIAFIIIAKTDFKFLPETLVNYRQHEGQQLGVIMTNNATGNKFGQMTAALKVLHIEQQRIEKITNYFRQNPLLKSESSKVETAARPYLEFIKERITHYEARTNLPALKAKRFSVILKEWQTGRYEKYSKGFRSALKDFFSGY